MPLDEEEFEKIEVEGKPITVTKTKNYTRYRIRNPRLFRKSSMRTLDIGKPKGHQLIRGRLLKNNQWKTQSVIAQKGIPKKLTRDIVTKAVKYQ